MRDGGPVHFPKARHEVYSFFMIYAFMLPLSGGTLPDLLISLQLKPPCHHRVASVCGHPGIAAHTAGCIVQGILDICGTTNQLTKVYAWLGALLLAAALLALVFQRAGEAEKQDT